MLQDLREHGWAVIPKAGFTDGEVVDEAAVRGFFDAVGMPFAGGRDSVLWPIRPRSTEQGATFSVRAGEAAPHTDSAYRPRPERWIALLCVRPATEGGVSTVLDGRAMVAGLDPQVEVALRRRVWKWRAPAVFGGRICAPAPVLGAGGSLRWRHDNLVAPPPEADEFAAHVAEHREKVRIPLATDSALFLDNHRVLHGRTSFTDPGRWLLRARLEVAS